MSSGIDIWGIVTGAIGTLGLLPVFYALVVSQFPSAKIVALDEMLSDTECLFRTATEECLLKDSSFVSQTRNQLTQMRTVTESLRLESHCATTFLKQFGHLLSGMSWRISILCHEVKELRASVAATSSAERKRLLAERGISESLAATDDALSTLRHTVLHLESSSGHANPQLESSSSIQVFPKDSNILPVPVDRACPTGVDAGTALSHCGVTTKTLPDKRDSLYDVINKPRSLSIYTGPLLDLSSHQRRLRGAHKVLQRADRDLAVRGRGHPILSRFTRSKHPMKPNCVSCIRQSSFVKKGVRRKGYSHTLVLEVHEEDEDGWEDEDADPDIISTMPELLLDSPPTTLQTPRQ
ncbi:hypothetical protein B0H21DRAFT_729538 [Amylocystis lapponica]|nr:hypothetical protein B0H21DRAFT_729538 [Amylocystis lapponica]